ncbi:MAG: PcfJ domain-containing protein, partial [Alphaproteobacteria bacterium]|nr:PcfJ domain-containing protein [Alphaproteobacteria bacterium]
MKIVNYREYLSYLHKTYAAGQDQTILSYAQDMLSSGKKQHMQKQKLQKEINILTAKINTLREELKPSTDKKSISGNIKKLKQSKNQLVQKLKQHSQTTRFATLSNESKAALCTLTTLRKYLTQELFQNDFHFFPKDENGNIFFSAETFRQSGLHPEAQHLKDYISAYIIQNPQKVLNEYYFNKLFGKHSNWLEIQKQIDKFFLEQNKALKNKSRAEIIAESHKDIEIIKEYPSNNTILVHLKTPEALDYEGSYAHNCVGGGSYDKLLQEQNSGIYSLRQIAPDNLLIPIATIELQKGNIKQIQGKCNSTIPYHHCQDCRDAVMCLMNTTDIQSLVDNKNISESALNRLGIFRNDNQYLDIYTGINANTIFVPDLRISSQEISDYNWENITINQLTITDPITNKNLAELKKFSQVISLKLSNIAEDLSLDLSSYNKLQKLNIYSQTCPTITLSGQNTHLKKLQVQKIKLQNTSLENFPALENIDFSNTDVTNLTINPEIHAQFSDCVITIPMLKQHINISEDIYYTTTTEKNKVFGEYLDLSDLTENIYMEALEFINLKEIKFAPHIKEAFFS